MAMKWCVAGEVRNVSLLAEVSISAKGYREVFCIVEGANMDWRAARSRARDAAILSPAEGPFGSPAPRQDLEAGVVVDPADDVDDEIEKSGLVQELGSIVGAVIGQMLEPLIPIVERVQDCLASAPFRGGVRRQVDYQQATVGVDGDMAPAADGLFERVVAAPCSRRVRLHRLAVHDARWPRGTPGRWAPDPASGQCRGWCGTTSCVRTAATNITPFAMAENVPEAFATPTRTAPSSARRLPPVESRSCAYASVRKAAATMASAYPTPRLSGHWDPASSSSQWPPCGSWSMCSISPSRNTTDRAVCKPFSISL